MSTGLQTMTEAAEGWRERCWRLEEAAREAAEAITFYAAPGWVAALAMNDKAWEDSWSASWERLRAANAALRAALEEK